MLHFNRKFYQSFSQFFKLCIMVSPHPLNLPFSFPTITFKFGFLGKRCTRRSFYFPSFLVPVTISLNSVDGISKRKFFFFESGSNTSSYRVFTGNQTRYIGLPCVTIVPSAHPGRGLSKGTYRTVQAARQEHR